MDDLVSVLKFWPPGGLVSSVPDLIKLGNALINSYKKRDETFLKSATIKELWTPIPGAGFPPHFNYSKQVQNIVFLLISPVFNQVWVGPLLIINNQDAPHATRRVLLNLLVMLVEWPEFRQLSLYSQIRKQ